MKKNIVVAFFISVFLLIALSAVFSVFKIKKVAVTFDVAENCPYDTKSVQEELDGYLNKNLLFFDLSKVESLLTDYPYLKVESLEKSYPNYLTIELKQRQEVYFVSNSDGYYILDKTGFVIEKSNQVSADLIELKLTTSNITVGQKISVIEKEKALFDLAISVVDNENFTNTVDYLQIVVETEKQDLILGMTTGVKIEIQKATIRGQDKLSAGLKCYDEDLTDRHKYTHDVLVFEMDDGNLSVTHTERSQNN